MKNKPLFALRGSRILRASYFTALLLFALCVSVVFGITMRSEPKKMLHFGAYCFGLFVLGAIVASWAMWLIHR